MMHTKTHSMLIAALLLWAAAAHSQAPASPASAASAATQEALVTAKPPATTPSPADCPSPENFAKVKVTRAYRTPDGGQDGDNKATASTGKTSGELYVRLRHGISVEVEHMSTLLERRKCATQRKNVVLFLDDRPLKDLQPYPPSGPQTQTLYFQLERNETSREVWTHLLGKPSFKARPVKVSVGLEDEAAVPSDGSVLFEVIPHWWFAMWAAIFLALLVSFWVLAVKSDVLRNAGPELAVGARKPYSLARMQAAVWFFLILASYLFIGIITGDYGSTITSTVLGLMGISAGTAIGSSVIDAAPVRSAAAAAAAAVAAAVPGVPPALPVAAAPPAVTKGSWWLDILSDERGGVNFHRFQMASWTLVLGIVFIQQVYRSLAMPDFDATLLGLLGISAGTYLGLKTTTEPG